MPVVFGLYMLSLWLLLSLVLTLKDWYYVFVLNLFVSEIMFVHVKLFACRFLYRNKRHTLNIH